MITTILKTLTIGDPVNRTTIHMPLIHHNHLTLFRGWTQETYLFTFLQILLASGFIGVCAQISIPLHFTPIPLTGQTLGVLLTGAFLGGRKGAAATLLYLAQGAIGLPVFAGGGAGAHYFFSLKGGYYLAFIVEAYLAGTIIAANQRASRMRMSFFCFMACIVHISLGALWLSHFIGIRAAFMLGFIPFLPGELFKSLMVASLYKQWNNTTTH